MSLIIQVKDPKKQRKLYREVSSEDALSRILVESALPIFKFNDLDFLIQSKEKFYK